MVTSGLVEKTSVYMPADLKARLRATAEREQRPEAELIREATEQYLRAREADLRPASWRRFAPKQPRTDDEATLGKEFGSYITRHASSP